MKKHNFIAIFSIGAIFVLSFLFAIFAQPTKAATYKINTKGAIKTPQGNSVKPMQTNYFNNYTSQNYINNKIVKQGSIGTIDIVMDYSGSMEYWIKIAKQVMAQIIDQTAPDTKIGFRTFGEYSTNKPAAILGNVKKIVRNKNKYSVKAKAANGAMSAMCRNTISHVGVSQKNTSALLNAMNMAQIGGATPLTLALQQACDVDFSRLDRINKKKILLITDGYETCGGDPCAWARELMRKRSDIVVDVVLVSSDSNALVCVTNATGGTLYSANDAQTFIDSILDSVTKENNNVEDKGQYKQNYEYTK